jgi:hypothetical protein
LTLIRSRDILRDFSIKSDSNIFFESMFFSLAESDSMDYTFIHRETKHERKLRMAKVASTRGRGRPSLVETASQRRDVLVAVRDGGEIPSRPVLMKLVEAGLLAYDVVAVDGERGRGRPAKQYSLTGKARSLIALVERNAAKAAAKE